MRRHVKASPAGSIGPSGKRRVWSLLAVLALALCALGNGASFASAAAPTVLKTDDATEVGYTTAKVSGEVEPDPAFETDCKFEYVPVADFAPQNEVKRLTIRSERGIYILGVTGQYSGYVQNIPANASAATLQSALEGVPAIGPGNVTVTGGPGGSSPYLITFIGALANKHVSMFIESQGIEGGDNSSIQAELVTVSEGHTDGWEIAKQAPCEPENPLTTPSITPVSANLTELRTSPSGVEYRFRLTASNQDGKDSKEAANTFTTKPVSAPTVSIDPVTTFTATTAHLVGHVTPGGTDSAFETKWHFECDPVCPGMVGDTIAADESSHEVTVDATGLEPNTDYNVKLVASNAGGSESTGEVSFKTPAIKPDATTVPAFALGSGTEALLGGKVNAHNAATEYWFEWGSSDCSANPCQETPHAPAVSNEIQELTVIQEPTVAASLFSLSYQGKTTSTLRGDVDSAALASALQGLSTIGPGNVSVRGTRAGFLAGHFLISFTGALAGTDVPELGVAAGPLGTYVKTAIEGGTYGNRDTFYSPTISGLTPASKYHFRLVTENASGESKGEDLSFETPPPAEPLQTNCPNAKLRTETNSAALPECRAYELASAPDKNGNDVRFATTTSPDGTRVAYYALGGFGDAQAAANFGSYIAERGPTGWTSRSIAPPVGSPSIGQIGGYTPAEPSFDLSVAVFTPDIVTAEEPTINNVMLVKPGSAPIRVTAPTVPGAQIYGKRYAGRSADASHIFFESKQEFVAGDGNGQSQIWEWFDGKVSLVSAQEDGSPFPDGATLGTGANAEIAGGFNFPGEVPQPTVVSADGSRAFFTGLGSKRGVYVRENGQDTRPVSVSQRTGSVGDVDVDAAFVGASLDGSLVFLRSEHQLTDDATVGGGFYSYDLETNTMHFIAADVVPIGLPLKYPVLVSDDGERVYFTSSKVLVPGKGVEGGKNLYTANTRGGELAFVATVEPKDLDFVDGWPHTSDTSYANATPDGDEFAFDSTARLTAFDNSGHRELYLYDASSGSLRCFSCSPDGAQAQTDATLRYLPIEHPVASGHPRGITSDGSAVFFETGDGLVPEDDNGVRDVYQYRNGHVSLISTGTSAFASLIVDISPDGKNVFFTSHDRLVGQDIDGNKDIYDARVDGGFPPPPPPVSLCEGDACQGQAHGAPPYSSPGTASLVGRGNVAGRNKRPRRHQSCGRKSKKQRSKCGKAKKHKSKQQAKQASKSGRGE